MALIAYDSAEAAAFGATRHLPEDCLGPWRAAFGTAGFTRTSVDPVAQVTAPSLREAAATFRREAHTPLQLITDEAYAVGLRGCTERPGP
jgi:hypothetical protein